MENFSINSRIKRYGIVLAFLFSGLHGYTQDPAAPQESEKDSATAIDIIPFNEVLIAAGESRVRTIRMSESLVSRERIEREQRHNDSVLVWIDSALMRTKAVDYNQKSLRFLTNERNYWTSANNGIKSQKKRLSDLIRDLQNQQAFLEKDLGKWSNTQKLKDSSYAFGGLREVIAAATGMLDSLAFEIRERTRLLVAPLNQIISREVEVELLLEKIQQALLQKSSLISAKTAPALFEPEAYQADREGIFLNMENSLRSEWNALNFHFGQRKQVYGLYLVFVLGVLVLFFWLRPRLESVKADGLSYYVLKLKAILQKPLSAGILFSLFFTMVFFPDRPPLLVDLIILALLVPLLDICLKLIPKKAHGYLWGYSGLLLALLIIRQIPIETLLYRCALLGLGLAQLPLLFRLYRHPEVVNLPSHTFSKFVRLLVVFHLLATSAGIIANVLGYVHFSEVAIVSFVTNALVGIVLFICATILTGGLQIFIGSRNLDRFQVIRENEDYLKGLVTRIIITGVTLFWLDSILRIFFLKNSVYKFIGEIFTRDLSVGSMSFSLGKIVLFVFIIWLSIILSKIIKIILRADVLDKLSLKKGVPRMITAVTQTILITLGVLFAVRAIGMPLDQLTIIFSAFSVGIGFGLQNIFNNLVSGVILLFERPVQLGDIIEVGNLVGKVESMGIRSSHIQTFDGAEVIVPNGQLISQEVVNWTLSDKSKRIEIISGVAYGSDVHLVKKLLMQVLQGHPDIKQQPPPMVLFNAMAESSLDFRLLFWTEQFDEWLRIRSEVIFAIHDILYANDISIPFPQRDLHLKSADPSIFGGRQEMNPRNP